MSPLGCSVCHVCDHCSSTSCGRNFWANDGIPALSVRNAHGMVAAIRRCGGLDVDVTGGDAHLLRERLQEDVLAEQSLDGVHGGRLDDGLVFHRSILPAAASGCRRVTDQRRQPCDHWRVDLTRRQLLIGEPGCHRRLRQRGRAAATTAPSQTPASPSSSTAAAATPTDRWRAGKVAPAGGPLGLRQRLGAGRGTTAAASSRPRPSGAPASTASATSAGRAAPRSPRSPAPSGCSRASRSTPARAWSPRTGPGRRGRYRWVALRALHGGGAHPAGGTNIPFVVRPASAQGKVAIIAASLTWQAYNICRVAAASTRTAGFVRRTVLRGVLRPAVRPRAVGGPDRLRFRHSPSHVSPMKWASITSGSTTPTSRDPGLLKGRWSPPDTTSTGRSPTARL